MNTYKTFDIVVVPFPFTDSAQTKNRPAIILSSETYFNHSAEHSILAMITSAKASTWPMDLPIKDLKSCGLQSPSIIRFKLFTLDHRLIKAKIGTLNAKEQQTLQEHFSMSFYDIFNKS